MSATRETVIHTLIDVLCGRRNLAPHEADELHEAITPGYSTPPPTAEQIAAARAVLAQQQAAAAAAPAPAAAGGDSTGQGAI